MLRHIGIVSSIALLMACGDGQPLFDDDTAGDDSTSDVTSDPTDEPGDGASSDLGTLPPGTDSPTATSNIIRFEARNEDGGGYVNDVSYDAANDQFIVDNIAFDGENVYDRYSAVPNLGGYSVFAAEETVADSLTGNAIGQIVPYRALVATSSVTIDGAPRTSFALVRTGGYINEGFGGWVITRSGGVTIPTTGQATFSGDYGGFRVYENASGLDLVQGQMALDIDFEDFNANDGIKGRVTNRQLFDGNGNFIKDLSNINWNIVEGVQTLTEDGEIVSNVFTTITQPDGTIDIELEGTFNGIMAGDTLDANDGGEIVGIIVMKGEDVDRNGVNIQESGGAILSR